MMDFFTSTAIEKAVDGGFSKISEYSSTIKIRHNDITLVDKIRNELLDKYGNEPFYNDFDSYLTHNKIIESLIHAMRHSLPQAIDGHNEFATQNRNRFLNRAPAHHAYSAQIEAAFINIYYSIYYAVTDINPYSDLGKLQSEMRILSAETNSQFQAITTFLRNIQNPIPPIQNEMTSQSLPDFSAKAKKFKEKINEIETTYQHQGRFSDALIQYGDLAISIAEAEICGDAKSSLLCALRCNTTICYSNLGDVEKAWASLEKIPSDVAHGSEIYNYVWASVAIQHKLEDIYPKALERIETALKLKPEYHRAFFFRQYLQALLEMKNQDELINELSSYFSKIPDEQKETLSGEYYAVSGFVCTTFSDYENAYKDYEAAAAHGYNKFVSQFNMSAALYGQAVKGVPSSKRILHPKVDMPKLFEVLDELKGLLQSELMDKQAYQDVKISAIGLYVSVSSIIKGSHDLQPLQSYLPFAKDYETTRMLLLGSEESLTPEMIQLLDEDDRFLLNVRQLLQNGNPQKCREMIERRMENPDCSLSPDITITLLQLCMGSNDVQAYRKYRNRDGIEEYAGSILTAMDACAYELEGDIENAKRLLSEVAQTCTDYHVLENVVRFFRRSNSYLECEALYFRIQALHNERKIHIDDLDKFYCAGLDFMLSKKRNTAKEFFVNVSKEAVLPETYSYLENRLYQALNDAANLYASLIQKPYLGFQDKVNQAICQRLMCQYDSSLETCLGLIKDPEKPTNEQLVKVYWLISDLYMFKQMPDESYSWGLKAHELMEKQPYDQSHSAFLGRAIRSGHFEGLSIILEYQKVHPVVVDYLKPVSVSSDGEDMPQKLLQKLEECFPNAPDFVAQEQQLASAYKNLSIPINILLQCYNGDWGRVFSFAHKNKLHLGTGDLQRQQLEESWVSSDIVTDAQTLIIMAACGCLPVLQMMEHVHISYSTVSILQYCYLSKDFNSLHLDSLMDWISSEGTVIFEPDGMIDENDILVQVFSKDFSISCNIAQEFGIPFLCADILIIFLQKCVDSPISKDIHFITLPVICRMFGADQPGLSAQMLYELMKLGKFISFSASTVFEHIKNHDFRVSEELLQPFLVCRSDYDMQSFAGVYLGAVKMLKKENEVAAVDFSSIILKNAIQVWRRGTYYRETYKAGYDDGVKKSRALSILRYTTSIIVGIEKIWGSLPKQIVSLRDELREVIEDELA